MHNERIGDSYNKSLAVMADGKIVDRLNAFKTEEGRIGM